MRKIKLLISDTAPLYPPLWGGPKRIWGLYSHLDGNIFDITYVGVDPSNPKEYKNRKVKDNVREVIQPLCDLYYPFRRFELRVIKNLTFDIFTYLLMWFDNGFKEELNKYDADILISSHPWSSPCFKIKKDRIFIYDAHNCEYLLMKQILKGRWYRWIISFFVRVIEYSACRKSKIIIVSSDRDKESFIRLYRLQEEKIFVIPNGTYVEPLVGDKKRQSRARLKLNDKSILLFIGAYYNPNIEAAKFIVDKIASSLKDVNIAIVGTVGDYFKNNNVPENVKLVGRVNDGELYDWLSAADIGINPVLSGSGINMKMLDYFSYGLPVVSTWVGARGIEGVDSRDFIACDKKEFVKNIRELLSHKELQCKIGRNARCLAEEIYDWKRISKNLNDILSALVKYGEVINNKSFDKCWRM